MVLFTNKNKNIVLTTKNKFVVYNSDGNIQEILIPDINLPPNLTKNQIDALKCEKVNILTCAFSNSGDYFAVATSNKQVVVYYKDFKVLNNLNVNRTVSRIRFTNSENLVVADKTGDVYLYNLKTSEVTQVLGHLSMVLDVLATKNDKFIITCDRDEKIRVSHFPNSYNIVSFCLGHEEFVLKMELLDENTLISGSGDGTLRIWEFLTGELLNVVNTNDFIENKNLVSEFSSEMDKETVDISALPITDMKLKLFDNFSIIICSLHMYNTLLVFKVINKNSIELLQKINFESSIISFDLSEKLYVLLKSGIVCYNFDNIFVENGMQNNRLKELFKYAQEYVESICSTENISVLYKRKFDNVQEYQERKKLRMENKK